ncbi:hypothetical protein GGX14DRAFT_578627 [Mycena pura]|uniref:Uncharacterized protein n=1 Tax=Mycena pura TaxID=153505 RepID=A0AAD6UTE5_9AGAR|nr:hypothetical protein GGX14DRAFT_578627 [Mycena pura]
MSTSNIVLPPLQTWAEQHLSAVIKATAQADFDAAFDAFVAASARITVNGKQISRDAYKTLLRGASFDEAGAEVAFGGAVQVSTNLQAGVVGLFYTATIGESIVVMGAPIVDQVTSSVNLVIEEDKTLTPPQLPAGVRGFFDGRRVTALNQVIVDARGN